MTLVSLKTKAFNLIKLDARPSLPSKRIILDLNQIWLYLIANSQNGSSFTFVERPQQGSRFVVSASFVALETALSSRRSNKAFMLDLTTRPKNGFSLSGTCGRHNPQKHTQTEGKMRQDGTSRRNDGGRRCSTATMVHHTRRSWAKTSSNK
jgi:hypothetical protein